MRVFAALILVRLFAYPGACSSEPLAWLGSCAVLLPAYVKAVRELRQRAKDESSDPQKVTADIESAVKE